MTNTNTNDAASSWIKDYSWHKDELSIWVSDTVRYDYYDFPEPVYEQFDKSHSKGKFFNKNIRDQYPFAKVICEDRIAA